MLKTSGCYIPLSLFWNDEREELFIREVEAFISLADIWWYNRFEKRETGYKYGGELVNNLPLSHEKTNETYSLIGNLFHP